MLTHGFRKLNALTERRARVRFENLNTTLASMQIHCRAIAENVQGVREQIEKGTRMVRDDIESSSRETSLALHTFQQNCIVTVAGFLKNVGALSKVTFQTLYRTFQNTIITPADKPPVLKSPKCTIFLLLFALNSHSQIFDTHFSRVHQI